MIQLRKVSETATKITLGWSKVANADGYRFYVNGKQVSRTCDRNKTEVTFGKVPNGQYTVEAVFFSRLDEGTYPTDPPPVYVKVAPRVAYAEGGADARFCMFETNGTLRPGVTRRSDGKYTDESGAVYAADGDGLEESGIRSPAPAVTGARQIDGRPFCSLPLEGDPTRNTGSWLI